MRNLLKDKVAPIAEKMRASHSRWFNHKQWRAINTLVRENEMIQVEGTKKKGKGS